MKRIIRLLAVPIIVILAIPLALVMFVRSRFRGKAAPPRAASVEAVQRTEKKLGFEFPPALRTFFTERPSIGRGCSARFTLEEATREYRMATRQPYGPNGQDWPRNLFPFADLQPGYACFDLATSLIVEWDPEELGEDDDRPELWEQSFTYTGLSLPAWLNRQEAGAGASTSDRSH